MLKIGSTLKNADKEENWRKTIGTDYTHAHKMVDLNSPISIVMNIVNVNRRNSNQKGRYCQIR